MTSPFDLQKAKEVHPDVNPSPQATKLFAEINEAFQILDAEIELPKVRLRTLFVDYPLMFALLGQDYTENERRTARGRART